MGKRFNRRYPPNGRIMFDGGLSNKYEKSIIPDNESPDCANVIFTNGSVETRGGTDLLNTAAVGSFACDGLFTRHDNVGNQSMVAWFGGTLYDWTGTTFSTVPSAQSVYSASERVYAAEYENYMFFGNGSGTPYKYGGDSDTFTWHGVPSGVTAPSVATAATGTALTGEYRYKVTFVNSALVEGNPTAASTTFTAASENIALTGIPVAPQSHGVSARNIYRTITSGTTFLRVATINDNTTTTYDDAIADASLGVEAPIDNGEPPNYSAVIYHQGRLFVIDPDDNLIKYSDIGSPYTFGALSFLRVGDNTFDIPTGFEIYDNSLVVLCQQNPWIIYMPSTTASEWVVLRVRANFGCKSPFGTFKYNSKVMFPAVQNDKFVGFAAISGQTVSPDASILTNSAVGSELKSDRIEPDMFDVQEGYLKHITSIVYKNKAYISLTKAASNTTNNRIYVFDFSITNLSKKQEASWVPWTGLNANDFTILDGDLYYADSTAVGKVYQMNTSTYNDNGSAINSYYWTKEFSGMKGEESYEKDFRFVNILYEKSGSYDMNFTYRVDSGQGSGNTDQINLDAGGSNWGTLVWGTDNWDPGQSEGDIRKSLANARGKRIQFKFSNQNTANQKFKIVGLNFLYNNKGFR